MYVQGWMFDMTGAGSADHGRAGAGSAGHGRAGTAGTDQARLHGRAGKGTRRLSFIRTLFIAALLFQLCLLPLGAETIVTEENRVDGQEQYEFVPSNDFPVQVRISTPYNFDRVTYDRQNVIVGYDGDGGYPIYGDVDTEVSRIPMNGIDTRTIPGPSAAGGVSPSEIANLDEDGRLAAIAGLASGADADALNAGAIAFYSLATASGVDEERRAQLAVALHKAQSLEDQNKAFAEVYGDPVKLSTGAVALKDTDIRVVMPGRAEDFNILRDYDSGRVVVGFFGLGWTTGMESRFFLGRDEQHWPSPDLVSGNISDVEQALQELDAVWPSTRAEINGNFQILEENIQRLSGAQSIFASRANTSSSEALRWANRRLADRIAAILRDLRPRLASLRAYRQGLLNSYNMDRNALVNARTDLQDTLAESEEHERVNAEISRRNRSLFFTGQSVESDGIGRENLMLIPLFGGNRLYEFDSINRDHSMVYRNESRPLDQIVLSMDGAVLHEMGGFSVSYDLAGRVLSRSLNDTLLYSFDWASGPGRGPESIELYGGRNINIEWTNGVGSVPKISRIFMGDVLIRSYEYEGDYLRRVIYPNGSMDQYGYVAVGEHERLYQIEHFFPEEDEPVYVRTYGYDADGRVLTVEDTQGLSEVFAYRLENGRIAEASYTNTEGQVSWQGFNENLQEITVESPVDGFTEFTRDGSGRVVSSSRQIDGGLLAVTSFVYSDIGTVVSITGPTGGVHQMDYDAAGRMTRSRDADGVEVLYRYDEWGSIHEVIYGDGSSEVYQHNIEGLNLSYIDQEGMEWQYEYDSYGYLASIRDPLGYVTSMRHDEYGRPLSIINPEGGQWQYEYDSQGRRTETGPLGHSVQASYESYNVEEQNVEARKSKAELVALWPEEMFSPSFSGTVTLNALELPASIDWPDGGRWSYEYSPAGRLVSAWDPAGGLSRYTYDARGFLIRTEHPDGSLESFRYDRRGLLLEDGRASFTYDAVGRLSLVETAAGVRTIYIRDGAGQVIELIEGATARNPFGLRHRRYQYDAAGNIIRIEEGQDGVAEFEYDSQSRLLSTGGTSVPASRHVYGEGLLEVHYSPGGSAAYTLDDEERTTSYVDGLGNKTDYIYGAGTFSAMTPGGAVWTENYDSFGRVIEKVYPNGISENRNYDASGNVTERSIGDRQHQYQYDSRGNLIREITELGEEYRYQYNEMNERIREDRPGGFVTEYDYEDGLLSYTGDSLGNSYSYRYGEDGQLRTVLDSSGEVVLTYDYDALGRLIFAATAEVINNFQWNVHNDLVSSWDSVSDVELFYEYDAQGRLLSLRDSSGFIHEMSYEEGAELTGIRIVPMDEEVSIERDELGRVVRVSGGAGVAEGRSISQNISYNENGAQKSNIISSGASDEVVFAELYAYDSNVRRKYRIDEEARLTFYEYDDENRLSALYEPYRENSGRAQHWHNADAASSGDLNVLWQDAGLPGGFSSYQVTDRKGLESEIVPEFDVRGNVSSWQDDDGRRRLFYDGFGRVSGMELVNSAQGLRVDYVYDGLNRVVLELYEVRDVGGAGGARDVVRRYAVVFVHQGLLPQPYLQFEYDEVVAVDGGVGDDSVVGVDRRFLEQRRQENRYRTSFAGAGYGFSSANPPEPPALAARRFGKADRVIWYAYRDGLAQTAVVLAGGSLRGYVLFEDGNMNVRRALDIRGDEVIELDYAVYGESDADLEFISWPGFAGVMQNRITGLSNFGYRFYSPRLQRFLTIDPIRSGYDWMAYSDNDPVNYRDVLGLKKQGFIVYDIRGENTFSVFFDDENPGVFEIVEIVTTNNLCDRQTPSDCTQEEEREGITTIPGGDDSEEYYIPQHFPTGSFNVTGVTGSKDDVFGSQVIRTDARREVQAYENYGGYWRPKVDENNKLVKVYDHGYHFHAGGYTRDAEKGITPMLNNDPTDSTRGCGRQSTEDNALLAAHVQKVLTKTNDGSVKGCAYNGYDNSDKDVEANPNEVER